MSAVLPDLPAPRTRDAPRILIVRLSALGDIVFASSLLDALRARWPAAQIHWLAQPGFAGILDQDPRLDRLIRLAADSLRSLPALLALRRELRAQHYDWVLDCQGLFKSRVLGWLAGGYRVGFASKEPGAFLMHARLPKGGDIRDISSEYRFLAEALTDTPAAPPRLLPGIEAQAAVASAMQQHGLAPGFVALCPFTTRPQKHWVEAHWSELADRLAATGLRCVLFGGPADREAAARIVAACKTPPLDLVGATKLAELPAWLAQAARLIGVDTGLTHIGIAVGTPVIALFGSTCPYTRLGGGADESRLQVIYDQLPCAPCRRKPTCDGRFDCMRGITPARVAALMSAS